MKKNLTERKMKAFLASQGGLSALRAAGFTPSDLRASGFTPSDLIAAGWTPSDMRSSGFTPSALRAAGFTPSDLRSSGWTPSDMRSSGFTPSDMRAARWTPSDLIAAGFTPSDMRASGWTPSALRAAEEEWDSIPVLEKPYSRLLAEIKAGKRKHDQSTFGPDCDPKTNLCGTSMCTAGHLVNMAGEIGYKLKDKYDWQIAARLIHMKSRPDVPPQNFGGIQQEFAMAYIEERAAEEEAA